MRSDREADHWPPPSAEVTKQWSFTSTPLSVFMEWYLKLRGNFSLTLYILYFTPKVQKNLSLCLIKHLAMETYWGVELYLHTLLTSALDGDEWAASLPCHFTPEERVLGTHLIRGWVDPTAGLDAVVKRKKSHPSLCRELNPGPPARILVSVMTLS
jgi:hypothetical protein